MSAFSFIKEATGGTTVIANSEEHFFGGNFSPHFKVTGNTVRITIGEYDFKPKVGDTISINTGSGAGNFAGTTGLQLKAALIPAFPKAGGSALPPSTANDLTFTDYTKGVVLVTQSGKKIRITAVDNVNGVDVDINTSAPF